MSHEAMSPRICLLLPRETHVIRAPARAPEELCRDDQVRTAEVELLDHPAAERGEPVPAIKRTLRIQNGVLTYIAISFSPPEYDSAQSSMLMPLSHAVWTISCRRSSQPRVRTRHETRIRRHADLDRITLD